MRFSIRTCCMIFALSGSLAASSFMAAATDQLPEVLAGKIQQTSPQTLTATESASIVLPQGRTLNYRVTGTLTLKPRADKRPVGPPIFFVNPPGNGTTKEPGIGYVALSPSTPAATGSYISVRPVYADPEVQAAKLGRKTVLIPFWPAVARNAKWMEDDGLKPGTWADRPIPFQIDVSPTSITYWVYGRIIHEFERPTEADKSNARPNLVLQLPKDDSVSNLKTVDVDDKSLFVPIDLSPFANSKSASALKTPDEVVPFEPIKGNADNNLLSLKNAGWIDQKRDPSSYIAGYDGGPYVITDDRMTLINAPRADYVAAHVFATAEADPAKTNTLTLRAGKYGAATPLQVLQKNFTAQVPRGAGFTRVVVPMTDVFAQDVVGPLIDIELTKEVHLVRHYPDPNRFHLRPVGPDSAVTIAGITLEKSPLQMTVKSDEAGHAFVLPKKPVFKVTLKNISQVTQNYTLDAACSHLRGQAANTSITGSVAAGQSAEVDLPVSVSKLGYYDIAITLTANDRLLLKRTTSFAQLPEDTRKHRDTAPWGAWDWAGTHFTTTDPDTTGSLFYKLGYRFGMSRFTQEQREKYGMISGFEPKLEPELKAVKTYIEADPKRNRNALMFHENSISGPHVTRVPDIFTGRPIYTLNETEKKRFDEMWKLAVDSTTALRKEFPDFTIKIGNGPLPLKEELYRHKFPAELFDAAGNEPGSYQRLPETQPPDAVAVNASLWMDRKMLDHYGYGDKPVLMCYEVGYPGDNPGNLSSPSQANYFVRHILHAMAWEQPFIFIGGLTDVGNSYYFSNWGSANFVRAFPENNVKPAYVAISNMTLALDGATFKKSWDTGTNAIYAMEFIRKDGQTALALWTIRGSRDVEVQTTSPNGWTLLDDQGETTENVKTVNVTASPVFLIGKGEITGFKVASPTYTETPGPEAVVVAPLANMAGWSVVDDRSAELEAYNPMTPRKKGNFVFSPASEFEGKKAMIKVSPGTRADGADTLPSYGQIQHTAGIPIPGKPNKIGVWVNGNTGWGRVIFELTDASGQRWTSIGASANGEINPWMLDWMPKEMVSQAALTKTSDWNTDDSPGHSRINFDGWRYVSFALPGQFPGQKPHGLPDNCYWKSDKDGVVHYPLTLRKVIIELPDKVLHAKDFAPPKRPEIYLKDVTVSQ